MPEYVPLHMANKYEDIVNLQGRRHIVAAARLQLKCMMQVLSRPVLRPVALVPSYEARGETVKQLPQGARL